MVHAPLRHASIAAAMQGIEVSVRSSAVMLTAVSALDKAMLRFRRGATHVEIIGMDEASVTIVDKLAVHDKADAYDLAPGTNASCNAVDR